MSKMMLFTIIVFIPAVSMLFGYGMFASLFFVLDYSFYYSLFSSFIMSSLLTSFLLILINVMYSYEHKTNKLKEENNLLEYKNQYLERELDKHGRKHIY